MVGNPSVTSDTRPWFVGVHTTEQGWRWRLGTFCVILLTDLPPSTPSLGTTFIWSPKFVTRPNEKVWSKRETSLGFLMLVGKRDIES
ncbi:hypothetical protein M407DRAFT_242490 [Tulasnella calospora MUT 4182]|uniref:Uncharacterized protein n=1 Tax=Tulasnella calospora MUT 4182 TaxID=1051891 RepID=A0A0C3QNY0_9AGAM|nr:hypothetical protein M407DRAFT_242490 [Tulasnella calospora MUT 4182]